MKRPINRNEFKSYILRKLGHPFHKIEVTDDQLDDCINDALLYYGEQVYDGTQLKFTLLTTTTAREYDLQSLFPNTIILAVEEIIDTSGFGSLYPSVFGLTNADIDFLFSLGRLEGNSLVDFEIQLQRISAVQKVVSNDPTWNYNANTGKLIFGEAPTVTAYGVVMNVITDYDGESDKNANIGTGRIWSGKIFQEYCMALVKLQLGTNLKKFSGFQIPGGGEVNGQQIYDEGLQEKEKIEEYLKENEFDPAIFQIHMG